MSLKGLCDTPEQAQEVLDRLAKSSNMPKKLFRHFEAIRDGTLPQYYYEEICNYRTYSDDLPEKKLAREWHPDYPTLKCRMNCIIGMKMTISSVMEYELIPNSPQIDEFLDHKWNGERGAKGEYWTLPEEIDLMNTTLDHIIDEMKEKYNF